MKVFLDTNVLVSAYATRGLCADVLRLVITEHELVTAEVVLTEVERVLTTKIRLSPAIVAEVIASLSEHRIQPRPSSLPEIRLRDPDDAWVLGSALASGADVLITGDDDLLDVATEMEGIRILDPRGFWTLLRGKP